VLIVETTRGDHATPPGFTRANESLRLVKAIGDAFQRGGCVLMPLFALGKTQEMLTMIYEFRRKGLLIPGPVYIGGLSTKLTEIYDKLAKTSSRLQHDLQILDAVAPFVLAGRQTEDPPVKQGRIYALSSGMMTEKTLSNSFARRILSDPKQTLIFVGYADPASPAGKIMQAKQGDLITLDAALPAQELRCTVERFNFSGHASRESIRAYANRVTPKKIILIHGDPSAVEWFRSALAQDLPDSEILVPTPGVPVEI
ncbi:MAG: MBL fold metallo-hydrolase RNA specificity domain-containing protein, partial [Verrucomicrobiota bacterium]